MQKQKQKQKKMVSYKFDEHQVLASICRASYYEFVKEFWSTIITEEPIYNWHIKYICDELQRVVERMFARKLKKDLIINISPGETKSTLCSVMLQPWMWTRMPSAQVIGGSYSSELSLDLSRKGRDIVLSDKYRAAFPEVELRYDQAGKKHFQNTKGGWRYATSTGGTITGFHGHLILVDDPLDPNRAASEVELKNANDWMKNTLANRKVDQSITPTILIMQRLHQDDCTASMMERAELQQQNAIAAGDPDAVIGIKHICLPARKSPDIRPRYLRRFYEHNVMDYVRLSNDALCEKEAIGQYYFAGQYMQNPIPAGGGMFKTDRILIDVPHVRSMASYCRFWDKAGTAGGDGAYTVGLLMGKDKSGRFWIQDVIRGRWSSDERENIIKQTAQIDGLDCWIGIEQEPGSGGKESAENTVRNLAGWKVFIDKPSGADSSKEQRADPFSVQVNSGNVLMVKAEWNRVYINELKYFPNSKYKDQVDASSGAFNKLSVGMGTVGAFMRKK